MNIFGALQCMMDGKRVRHEAWDEGAYIYMDEITSDIVDEEGKPYAIRHINEDDTWELYTEKEEEQKENMVSDGMGGFVYAYECEDDNNFVGLRMEVENGYGYDKVSIELYKDDIKELINILINLL